jgi:hypothetical protein
VERAFSGATASEESMMPVDPNLQMMWALSEDRKMVRQALPPLPLAGKAEPVKLFMDFDANAVDFLIERLTILRGQMLPPLPAPGKRN